MVIDDEPVICDFVKVMLERKGYQVFTFLSGREACEKFSVIQPDLVLLDMIMPEYDGFTVLEYLKKISLHIKVVVITGHSDIDRMDKISADMCYLGFVRKPFSSEELEQAVEEAFNYDCGSVS